MERLADLGQTGRSPDVARRRGEQALVRRLVRCARAVGFVVPGLVLMGCSAEPEWRSLQPEGWSLQASLPCRPDKLERPLPTGAGDIQWSVWTCESAGHRFVLGSGDVRDPAAVGAALRALREGGLPGQAAAQQVLGPASVPGMTPNVQALRYRVDMPLAAGGGQRIRGIVFARGTRLYQALLLGPEADEALFSPLVDGLRVLPD